MKDIWKKFSNRFPYEWDIIIEMTNTKVHRRIDITDYPKPWVYRSMQSDYNNEVFTSGRRVPMGRQRRFGI